MSVVSPKMIVSGHHYTTGTYPFDWPTGIASHANPVETANPPQIQIIFGVEDIHARISAFGQVVPPRGLIHPADIKAEWIARYENRADKFDGLVLTICGTRASGTARGFLIRILTRACAHCQGYSGGQCYSKKADHIRFHFVTPSG